MSLSDVLSNVVCDSGTDSSEETIILNTIIQIYNGSATAAAMLDAFVQTGDLIYFRDRTGDGWAAGVGTGEIWFDFLQLENYTFITNDGVASNLAVIDALLHELVHATGGLRDFTGPFPTDFVTPGYDYVGDTVAKTNEILSEMGITQLRNSYWGIANTDLLNDIGKVAGESLTNGVQVGVAITSVTASSDIDVSDRSDVALLIGGQGENLLVGGSGADYLYGASGNDFLFGSAGFDLVEGNDGNDTLVGGGGSFEGIPSLSTPHSEWNDGVRDILRGGDGDDTYYFYIGEWSEGGSSNNKSSMDMVQENYIDNENLVFQMNYNGSIETFIVTGQMLSDAASEIGPWDLGSFEFDDGTVGNISMDVDFDQTPYLFIYANLDNGFSAPLVGLNNVV